MLYITVEVEIRIAKQYNANAVVKITVERGWRVNKKCLCVVFGLIRRSRVCRKNASAVSAVRAQ